MAASQDQIGEVDITDFAYLAADGTATTTTSRNPPRIIADYIWAPDRDGSRELEDTIDQVLAQNIAQWRCLHCKDVGDRCRGQQCRDTFRANAANVWESLELRAEPANPALGFGAHCKRNAEVIPAGSILGEYLGELIPQGYDESLLKTDQFSFRLKDVALITAKNFGNWTRFMRHSCFAYNVLAKREMYGQRLVITFIARVDIRPGDQLFINYGRKYFTDFNKQCTCSWASAPHLPPTTAELKASGQASPPKPVLVDTLANMRLTRALLTTNHFPQVQVAGGGPDKFKDTRTFDIDIISGGFVTTKEFTIPRSALGNGDGTGTKTIDIDLVLRRRGGSTLDAGKVTKPNSPKPSPKSTNGTTLYF